MRKINEIIIHCTATPAGRNVSVDEIRQCHLKRGFNDIGYHYVIGLDGTIHDGRPIDKIGAHCKGHNRYSIGIAYVGGLDDNGTPCDTRTYAQKSSIEMLLSFLIIKYNISSIVGHNKYANKACPCYDVETECNNCFPIKFLSPINHDNEN